MDECSTLFRFTSTYILNSISLKWKMSVSRFRTQFSFGAFHDVGTHYTCNTHHNQRKSKFSSLIESLYKESF